MKIRDNHCHLEEIARVGNLSKELESARSEGISEWLSCALSRGEIDWHKSNKINGMEWCAGIHPHYDGSRGLSLGDIEDLAEAKEIVAIGEIGLDRRNPEMEWQSRILLAQLALARDYDLPVIFHVVRSYYELHKLLKDNFPRVRGYLHGFSGSREVFETFARYDLGFSLNARLPGAEVVKSIVKRGRWQIETDAPYASPEGNRGANQLRNLIWVKEQIENICGREIWH